MRLLQAMAGAPQGGAEEFFMRLARAFAARGVDQRVVFRTHDQRRETFEHDRVEASELPFGGWFDRRTGAELTAMLNRYRPDVVLSWMNRATRAVSRARRGYPGNFVHVARLGGYYDLKYYAGCDHLIGNTPDIVSYIADRGWPAERAHYLPNFVDAVPGSPVARASLHTPADAPLLLALGRLHRNKAFDVLIAALVDLPGHWLWLAGTGPEEQALKAQASAAGVTDRIRFLGWRDDIAQLLGAADILVCPSRHEPLGNVVIEGWAHRVPVVACASQGPSQLIDDGETGLLVPIDDAAGLARAITRAGDAEVARRLAVAGEAAYRRDYTEDVVVDRYLEFFETLMAREAA